MPGVVKSKNPTNHHLTLHRVIVFLLYVAATLFAYKLLSIPAAHADFITSPLPPNSIAGPLGFGAPARCEPNAESVANGAIGRKSNLRPASD